ncbi:MAG: dTDP-4-amino-4,6-dideoxygalactose transaminase [Bdellovibrionaceae bacterium]|nr:dTDP-4-amino-4,6-dideoxygalactose transaminase [Pseudobdellovibrionaceae bacterium]MDW8190968.1 dTDP-4-amino-4,6-dideoxygalactose transaminase [Pseudobdellovibrionaceae bacterium]
MWKKQPHLNQPIPFIENRYSLSDKKAVVQALKFGNLQGSGKYSQGVQDFFRSRYGFQYNYFTPSCTDALELSALAINLTSHDEVIVPSYTFPTTAHAFYLRGARIVLADSREDHPNVCVSSILEQLTHKTKAICIVHYGGVAVDGLKNLISICQEKKIFLIEDAAQAIDAYWNGQPLGSFGDFAAFSFHQTKNISCGEGGLCVVKSPELARRVEIIREKGTNRQAFLRGEVDKYTCVDVGSSFVGSDLNAALLLSQLKQMEDLHHNRKKIWQFYWEQYATSRFKLPKIDTQAQHNAHNFILLLPNESLRQKFIDYMKEHGIHCTFHYVPLHLSPFYGKHSLSRTPLKNAEKWGNGLVRLPLFNHMSLEQAQYVVEISEQFAQNYL